MPLFDQTVQGPPPGNATVGTEHWIDMGVIPSGFARWFGSMILTSPSKSITFELRSNVLGQSAGTTGATTLLGTVSVSPKSRTITLDLYKNGRLHTATVTGTGTEKWWLRLRSKSGTAGEYTYKVSSTLE
jgi:hypothetical protein